MEPSIEMCIRRGEGDDDRLIEINNCGVRGFDEAVLAEWRV